MAVVTLFSGGLDSALMAVLAKEQGIEQRLLFVDYGQRAREAEWKAACAVSDKHGLPDPKRMNLQGYGELIPSGLTRTTLDLNKDVFLPGRNLLLLLAGAAFAARHDAAAVAIGLLDEHVRLFYDQSEDFIAKVAPLLSSAVGRSITIVTPLAHMRKADVVSLSAERRISASYSCHAGTDVPCGACVSCMEFRDLNTQEDE